MLEKIEYCFPKNKQSNELFDLFIEVFKDLPNVTIFKKEIQLKSSNLKPETVLKLDDKVENLQLNIGNEKYLNLLDRKLQNRKSSCEVKKLPMKDVANKLAGHVKRVDHTGINFPSSLYTEKEWQDLLKYFSSVSNIYAYPTGEPWPFLLPATEEENKNEIANFDILREPRFEVVYDKFTDVVAIQIDMETDLRKQEVDQLFPESQGIYFDGLENIFKVIYLDYNEMIDIRFDVRFKMEHDDFESGEWFVKDGKRL